MNSEAMSEASNWSFVDVLAALGVKRRLFFSLFLLGAVVSVAIAYLIPRYYVASTVVLPPQQQQSAANAALAQLGALAGAVGGGASVKTSDNMYLALMKTRRLQDALIDKFDLKKRYDVETYIAARKELNERVSITSDKKSGLITVEVEDRDPQFAADMANAHVAELRKMLLTLAVTDAQQRRVFFEQQVAQTKETLSKAELLFRRMQKESGLVVSQALAESGVKESAQVRAQIASKEVQLRVISRVAMPENPDYQRVVTELAALRDQLSRLETGIGRSGQEGLGAEQDGLRTVQAYRDMKIQEALLEVYIRQFEAAKADESREGPLLQQVDVAKAPERALKPRRGLLIAIGFGVSFAMAFVLTVGVFLATAATGNDGWARVKSAWRT